VRWSLYWITTGLCLKRSTLKDVPALRRKKSRLKGGNHVGVYTLKLVTVVPAVD